PHVVGGPGGGVLLGARTRRARAEAGGELGDVVEGDIALQRLVAHLFGGADGPDVLSQDRRGDQAERQSTGGHQTSIERQVRRTNSTMTRGPLRAKAATEWVSCAARA